MQKVQPENRPEPSAPVQSVQPFRLRDAWLFSPVFLPRLPVSCALSFPCPVCALVGGLVASFPLLCALPCSLACQPVPFPCVWLLPHLFRALCGSQFRGCSEGVPRVCRASPQPVPMDCREARQGDPFSRSRGLLSKRPRWPVLRPLPSPSVPPVPVRGLPRAPVASVVGLFLWLVPWPPVSLLWWPVCAPVGWPVVCPSALMRPTSSEGATAPDQSDRPRPHRKPRPNRPASPRVAL